MKRIIIAAAVLALGTVGAGVSLADPPQGGPSTYGQCTAYFAGSANGQNHKHQAGPFQSLQQTAEGNETPQQAAQEAANGSEGTPDETAQDVADYCAGQTPGGK